MYFSRLIAFNYDLPVDRCVKNEKPCVSYSCGIKKEKCAIKTCLGVLHAVI